MINLILLVANRAPVVLNSDARIHVVAGESYTSLLTLDVYDADGDAITMTLNSGTPSGVRLIASTRTLRWTNIPSTASGVIEVFLSDGQATSSWVPEVKICNCQVSSVL